MSVVFACFPWTPWLWLEWQEATLMVCPLPSSPRLCPSSGQKNDQHCCDGTPGQLGTVHLDLSSCLDSRVSTPMTSWTRSCIYCSWLAFQCLQKKDPMPHASDSQGTGSSVASVYVMPPGWRKILG